MPTARTVLLQTGPRSLGAALTLTAAALGACTARSGRPSAAHAPTHATGAARSTSFARLAPLTIRYAFSIAGKPAGSAAYTLARVDSGWRHVADIRYGEPVFFVERSEIAFRPDLTVIGQTVDVSGGSTSRTVWRNTGTGTFVGTRRYPKRPERDTTLVVAAPRDVLVNMLDEHALSVTPLAIGETVRMPVVVTGRLRDVRFTPVATERVVVPAGTFETFRVEVRGYPGVSEEPDVLQVWSVTTTVPRRIVRQELPALRLLAEAVVIR